MYVRVSLIVLILIISIIFNPPNIVTVRRPKLLQNDIKKFYNGNPF